LAVAHPAAGGMEASGLDIWRLLMRNSEPFLMNPRARMLLVYHATRFRQRITFESEKVP
jgi:hypothetical protein